VAAVELTPADLDPFASIDVAKAQAMIDDALAMAATVAPCILTDTFANPAAAKAIVRAAVLRWHEAGNGSTTSETAGPYSVSSSTPRKGMFWPSEVTDLQRLCAKSGGAFSIDTTPAAAIAASGL
jgi:hypothetical protein